MRRFRAVVGLVAALACFTAAAAFAQDAQGAGLLDRIDWGAVAAVVSILGVGWRLRDRSDKNRDRAEAAIKAVADESKEAHKGITENINRVDGKVEKLRESVDEKIGKLRDEARQDRTETNGKIDRLIESVGGMRETVARIDATLKERAAK